MARLHRAIVGGGHACTPEELLAAFQTVTADFDSPARESFEDSGPPGRWAALARELGISDGLIPFEVVERTYEDITLNPPPVAMPYVHTAVEAMKQKGYRLGVICNTGMAGGRVLRDVLRHHGLFDLFDVTVFSNEFGYAKPHPKIFVHTLAELGGVPASQALHVGDMEQLDVEGARRAGLFSALYAPEAEADGENLRTNADFVVRDWRRFASQVARFNHDVMPG